MKNPFHNNFIWLSVLLISSGAYLICSLKFDYSLLPNNYTELLNVIVQGIFSSVILLFMFELIQYRRDMSLLGVLRGTYRRSSITQINENGQRSDSILEEAKSKKETEEIIKFIPGSKYHDLTYYLCTEEKYIISLSYHGNGNYSGFAEYYDHTNTNNKPGIRPIYKAKTDIILSLNSPDNVTGNGSYKYQNKQDYGLYDFQVVGKTKNEILVYYKNTLPSGLAEGYEVWTRISKKPT